MKKIIFLFLYIFSVLSYSQSLKLSWNYDIKELNTNNFFKIYSATNINSPKWMLINIIPGNVTNTLIQIDKNNHFFFISVSNIWGEPFAPKSK